MLPHQEAVVAGEDDDCVVGQAPFFEVVEKVADNPVESGDGLGVADMVLKTCGPNLSLSPSTAVAR